MKKKIFTILATLFGIMFINAGMNKFFNYIPTPEDMPEAMRQMSEAMMEINWLMPLIAIVEIVAGSLIISKRFRALGAIMIFPIMVGILLTHLTVAPSGLPMAIILLIILAWIMYENRKAYIAMVR